MNGWRLQRLLKRCKTNGWRVVVRLPNLTEPLNNQRNEEYEILKCDIVTIHKCDIVTILKTSRVTHTHRDAQPFRETLALDSHVMYPTVPPPS